MTERDDRADRSMNVSSAPTVIVLGGPNGAGKSTVAPALLRDRLGIRHFVNADEIAKGLSAYTPESVAVTAGKLMLTRIGDLAAARETFAFETTLATRSFGPRLRAMRTGGYRVELGFLMLPDAETAIERVRRRVRQGGHHVPEDTVRRRFARGLRNLRQIYMPLADVWTVYDATSDGTRRVASGDGEGGPVDVCDAELWHVIERG